jgi:hypothetical protein
MLVKGKDREEAKQIIMKRFNQEDSEKRGEILISKAL